MSRAAAIAMVVALAALIFGAAVVYSGSQTADLPARTETTP